MKNIIKKSACLASLGVALALTCGTARAQVTTNLFTFDTSAGTWASWQSEYEGYWDSSEDHTGNSGGSLFWYQDVSRDNGVQIFNTWGGNPYWAGSPQWNIDLSTATNISFWVMWDTTDSTLGINSFNDQDYANPPGYGDHGVTVGIETQSPGGQGTPIGTVQLPLSASNGWVQVNVPIGVGVIPNPNEAVGLSFWKWSNTTNPITTGVFAFWIDDIQAESPGAPPPPPTLSKLAPASNQGLNIYDDGNAGDRQDIATVVTNTGSDYNYSWIGSANPVTYSVNFAQAPAASYKGYQAQIMLFPGTNITETAPDWNEANALVLFMQQQTNGVIGQLRYKLNNAVNNSYLYGSDTNVFGPNPSQPLTNTIVPGYGGLLCSVTNANGFVGTWSIKIDGSGNITLVCPSQTNTAAFPSGDDVVFAAPLSVFWGTQPDTGGYFQDMVLKSVSITGSANTLNADLTQPLDPTKLVVDASKSALVFGTPVNAAYWLQWTLPDVSFGLKSASSLGGPWTAVIGSYTPTTNYVNTFDTSGAIASGRNYNPPPMGAGYDSGDDSSPTIAWAAGPTYDAHGNAASGSISLGWAFAGGSGNEAFTFDILPSGQSFSGATLSFDIMIDPSSTAGTNGDYGAFGVATRDQNYNWNGTSFYEGLLTAAGGAVGQWAHVSIPLGTGADSSVRALTFQDANDGDINGPELIYIDNVQIINSTPQPPATITINTNRGSFITRPMLPSNGAGFFRLSNP